MQIVNNALCRRVVLVVMPAALLMMRPAVSIASEHDEPPASVYVMSNAASGNSIMVYERKGDGTLTHKTDVATGGLGLGGTKDPLGSQGALALSDGGYHVLAVNAGSNSVSVLGVIPDGLWLETKADSGGTKPISLTVSGDLVYVLNAGGTPNITGFRFACGKLWPIPGGSHVIPGGATSGPAQVGFDPDGDLLFVTEKNTNTIDVFRLNDDGGIKSVVSVPSSGVTPFGFNFAKHGTLLVSEAAGGAPDASTISSYRIDEDGGPGRVLDPVTKALPIGQNAACWVAITRNRRFAFTANSSSYTIGSFRVSNDGALTLLSDAAATVDAGSLPTDMAVTRNGRYLYVIGAVTNSLFVFRIDEGTLTLVETETGIPASAQGVAAN